MMQKCRFSQAQKNGVAGVVIELPDFLPKRLNTNQYNLFYNRYPLSYNEIVLLERKGIPFMGLRI